MPCRVVVSLVPAGKRAQHCGARDIGLTSYLPDQRGPATVRYWTLKEPDAKRIRGHAPTTSTYADAC